MPDYKAMYAKLFNTMTDTVSILQQAQIEAEEMFISQEDAKITLLEPPSDKSE